MADDNLRASRMALIARVFPAASAPWMHSVAGLGYSGFLGSELANLGG